MMPFVVLPDARRIHYAERGERRAGATPVVLVHGAGASSSIWMMAMARIARAARVVAIDLPGHGPSPRPAAGAAGMTIADYRDAVGGLAAALCLGPSVLVGHSMGALVAIEATLAWPDKVRGLVLCGGAPRLPVRDELLELLRREPALRTGLDGGRTLLAARVNAAVPPRLRRRGHRHGARRHDRRPRIGARHGPGRAHR